MLVNVLSAFHIFFAWGKTNDLFEVGAIIIFFEDKLMCRCVIYVVQGNKITEW